MEGWLKEAKEIAKWQAESFLSDMEKIASEENIDSEWFISEVIKNIHMERRK